MISMHSLPDQIVNNIIKYLDVKDILALFHLSRRFRDLIAKSDIWQNLYSKLFAASYRMRINLEKRTTLPVHTRKWMLEFLKKYTEKRCAKCGVVHNCLNLASHICLRGKRKIKDKPAHKTRVQDSRVKQVNSSSHNTAWDEEDSSMEIRDENNYVYRRKCKYLKREGQSAAQQDRTKRILFAK